MVEMFRRRPEEETQTNPILNAIPVRRAAETYGIQERQAATMLGATFAQLAENASVRGNPTLSRAIRNSELGQIFG